MQPNVLHSTLPNLAASVAAPAQNTAPGVGPGLDYAALCSTFYGQGGACSSQHPQRARSYQFSC